MTEQEERSLRQRAIDHITEVRRKLNPQTTEHIAHAAQVQADDELRSYAEYLGWSQLKRLQEDAGHAQFRPTRSGHYNSSGRYQALKSILEMRYSIGNVSMELGEMTMPELSCLVELYDKRTTDLAAERDRLQAILAEVEARGVKRVKQLGAKRVEQLYNGQASHV